MHSIYIWGIYWINLCQIYRLSYSWLGHYHENRVYMYLLWFKHKVHFFARISPINLMRLSDFNYFFFRDSRFSSFDKILRKYSLKRNIKNWSRNMTNYTNISIFMTSYQPSFNQILNFIFSIFATFDKFWNTFIFSITWVYDDHKT